jgi:hypothetical protein
VVGIIATDLGPRNYGVDLAHPGGILMGAIQSVFRYRKHLTYILFLRFKMLKTLILCHYFTSLVLGFAIFPLERRQVASKPIWQPPVGAKFQIILDSYFGRNRNADLVPADADIFDVDLFDITADVIQRLHSRGKKVICYMNAGSSESWRPDYASIKAVDKGDVMKEWRREQWLDIRSPDIFEVSSSLVVSSHQKTKRILGDEEEDTNGEYEGL